MLRNSAKRFVVSDVAVPDWLEEQAHKGRIKLCYNEDEELVGATVFGPTKTTIAKVGDTIVLSKSGLSVLPRTTAKEETKENKKTVQ